jgi:hypothetical protein
MSDGKALPIGPSRSERSCIAAPEPA